jgi:hypothetical protein
MKKEAPLKHMGLEKKASIEKRGTPKLQGAEEKRLSIKKEAPLECKGLGKKTSNENIGIPKMQGARKKAFDKKEASLKRKELRKRPSIRKRNTLSLTMCQRCKQDRQVAAGSTYATKTVEGEGDTFCPDDHKAKTIPQHQ